MLRNVLAVVSCLTMLHCAADNDAALELEADSANAESQWYYYDVPYVYSSVIGPAWEPVKEICTIAANTGLVIDCKPSACDPRNIGGPMLDDTAMLRGSSFLGIVPAPGGYGCANTANPPPPPNDADAHGIATVGLKGKIYLASAYENLCLLEVWPTSNNAWFCVEFEGPLEGDIASRRGLLYGTVNGELREISYGEGTAWNYQVLRRWDYSPDDSYFTWGLAAPNSDAMYLIQTKPPATYRIVRVKFGSGGATTWTVTDSGEGKRMVDGASRLIW